MKNWSLETLSLTFAGVILVLATSVAVVIVADVNAVPRSLLALITLLAGSAILVALRIRAMAGSRNDALARARAMQRRYSYFVNTAHEGIWMVDGNGANIFANLRLAQMFGCTEADLRGASVRDYLGDNPQQCLHDLLSGDPMHAGRTYDLRYRRANGTLGWAIVSARPSPDEQGVPGGSLLMLTDISERKAAELELAAVQVGLEARIQARTAELQRTNERLRVEVRERQVTQQQLALSYQQLRQLTAHLETVKEDERKRIALDIHDDLGQNLLALKIDVQLLHQRTGARHPVLRERVGRALETIDATIRSVRAIINDLHPSTLELGLPAATEWLVGQFEKRSGMACTLSLHGDENVALDSRRATLIFRLIQDALVSIMRHGCATRVALTLALSEQEVAIRIVDNGNGVHPGDAGAVAALMLRGMQERVDVFGGSLEIDSEYNQGTMLSIVIPLDSTAELDQTLV